MILIFAALMSLSHAADFGFKGGWTQPLRHSARFASGFDGDVQILENWKVGVYYITSTHNGDTAESRINHYGFQTETRLNPYFGQNLEHYHLGARVGWGDSYRSASATSSGHAYTDFSLGLQARAGWTLLTDFNVGGEVAAIYNFGSRGFLTLYALVNVRYIFF